MNELHGEQFYVEQIDLFSVLWFQCIYVIEHIQSIYGSLIFFWSAGNLTLLSFLYLRYC